jgi:hypothetical protein
MTALLGRIIFGIPLWLTGLAGKIGAASVKFLAELVGIFAFRAKWYIVAIFWFFVLWALIKAEPYVKNNFSPAHGVYLRFIVTIMGLMLLAFISRNLRRRFRRAKLEVQVLNAVGTAKKHIIEVQGLPKPNKLADTIRAIKEKRTISGRVPEIVEGNVEESLDVMLAQVAAEAQAEVDAMMSGKPLVRVREPWNLGLKDKKISKAAKRKAERLREQQESDGADK